MKIKSTILAAALALGFAGLAEAATTNYVYFTGSTAARAVAYNTLASNVFDSAPTIIAYNNSSSSSLSGANFHLFAGLIGGTNVTVKCHWSGSEAGVVDVSTTTLETFLDDSVIPGGTQISTVPSGGQLVTNTVDLAMADAALAFSKNPGSSASQTLVAIIPFKWLLGSNTLASVQAISNVTDQQLRQNLTGGVPLGLYTGNTNDTSTFVYISGRNNNSGTRVNYLGETGYGIKSTVQQIELSSTTNGAMILPPAGDGGDGVNYYTIQGFDSGGKLAGTLGGDSGTQTDQINGGTGFGVVAYLGVGDAKTALSVGAKELSYNGVFESDNAIYTGQYNAWGNEYLLQRASGSTQSGYVLSKMKTGIPAESTGTASGAISLTTMAAITGVSRSGPTSDPHY